MSDNQKKRRDPHVFDDSKLRLYAPAIKPEAKQVSLQVKLIENNPTIAVDYGHATEKGHRVSHETPLNPVVFGQICQLLKRVAVAKGQAAFAFDNWGFPFMWDKDQGKNVRAKDKMNISRIEVGKHENGSVYLKYSATKKPEIEFTFTEDDYHKLLVNDEVASMGVSSPVAALAWADTMSDVFTSYYATKWVEPEWRKKFRLEQANKFNGGGNKQFGGGGNKSYGGGGGNKPAYQPEPSDDGGDDDIPF